MATQGVAMPVHSKGRGEPGEGSIVLQVVMRLWKETLQVDDVISSHQDGFERLSFNMTWTQKIIILILSSTCVRHCNLRQASTSYLCTPVRQADKVFRSPTAFSKRRIRTM